MPKSHIKPIYNDLNHIGTIGHNRSSGRKGLMGKMESDNGDEVPESELEKEINQCFSARNQKLKSKKYLKYLEVMSGLPATPLDLFGKSFKNNDENQNYLKKGLLTRGCLKITN